MAQKTTVRFAVEKNGEVTHRTEQVYLLSIQEAETLREYFKQCFLRGIHDLEEFTVICESYACSSTECVDIKELTPANINFKKVEK